MISIETLTPNDWPEVRRIYIEGIATGNATFQQSAPEWKEWDAGHLAGCRMVARREGRVIGWAALGPVSSRPVYRGVAEVSIYIAEAARAQGVGRMLLVRLIEEAEAAEIWTLQAGIFPENVASVELHKRCGFRVVGTREKLGCMHGRWRDVMLMERRSATVNAA